MNKMKFTKLLTLGLFSLSSIILVGCGNAVTSTKNTETTNISAMNNTRMFNEDSLQTVNAEITPSEDDDTSYNIIKNIYNSVDLPSTIKLDQTFLTDIYGISKDDVINYYGFVPTTSSATEVSIIKVKDAKIDTVKAALEERQKNQMQTFEKHLPEQYEIIKNSEIIQYDNYLVFISAEENTKNTIKELVDKSLSVDSEPNTDTTELVATEVN